MGGGSVEFEDGTTAQLGRLTYADLGNSLKSCQKVNVPNVWIAANLLHGGGAYNQTVNIGGTVGVGVGTGMFTQGGKKVERADSFQQLRAASAGKDTWGIVIFGHGNKDGYLGNFDGSDSGNQGDVISNLSKLGYRLSKAYAMQCYSHFVGKDDNGTPQNWWAKWTSVAIDANGFKGMNVMLMDTDDL